jgi:hypothetical protein
MYIIGFVQDMEEINRDPLDESAQHVEGMLYVR